MHVYFFKKACKLEEQKKQMKYNPIIQTQALLIICYVF